MRQTGAPQKSGIPNAGGIPLFSYESTFSMLFKLIKSVDVLCNIADVVGASTPATPSTIRPELKPTIVL